MSFLKYLIPASFLALLPTLSFAGSHGGNLDPSDAVGISFWIISIAMVAATVFFLMESLRVKGKWRTSLVVGALVTLVAAVHYFYMRDVWVSTGASPTVFRYVDWIITVPLQMIEFYLILAACTAVAGGVFWRLFLGSLVMLIGGYLGEAGFINATIGFVIGMAGWIFILYEIFAGEASKVSADSAPESVQSAFNTMKWIVTIGWAIYPIGYFMGYMAGGADANSLNFIYNIADVINKPLARGNEIRTVSFTERAAMRTQCRKLVRFIRLVDFFTIQAHLHLGHTSVRQLLEHIRETPESLIFSLAAGKRKKKRKKHLPGSDSDSDSL